MSNLNYDSIKEYLEFEQQIRDKLAETRKDIQDMQYSLDIADKSNPRVIELIKKDIESLRNIEKDLIAQQQENLNKYNTQDVSDFLDAYYRLENIDLEIEQTKIDLGRTLLNQKKMDVNYDNADKFRALTEKYHRLTDKLSKLQEEKKSCEETLNRLSNPENSKDVNISEPSSSQQPETTIDNAGNPSEPTNNVTETLNNQSEPVINSVGTSNNQSEPANDTVDTSNNQSNTTNDTINNEKRLEDAIENCKDGSRLYIVTNYMKQYQENVENINDMSTAIDQYINKLKENLSNAGTSQKALIEKEIHSIESVKPYANSNGLNRLNLHIDRLKDELANTDPSEKNLIEQYNKSIQESEQIKDNLENKIPYILRQSSKDNKIKLMDAKTKIQQTLTKEVKTLDLEIEEIDLDIRQVQLNMKRYNSKDTLNKEALIKQLDELVLKRTDLQNSRVYCKQQLQMFKEQDAKSVENINKILRGEDLEPSAPGSNNSGSIPLDMGDTPTNFKPEPPQSPTTPTPDPKPIDNPPPTPPAKPTPKQKKQSISLFKKMGSWFSDRGHTMSTWFSNRGNDISTWFSNTFSKKTKALPAPEKVTEKVAKPTSESFDLDNIEEGASKPYVLDKDGNKVQYQASPYSFDNSYKQKLKAPTSNDTINQSTEPQSPDIDDDELEL